MSKAKKKGAFEINEQKEIRTERVKSHTKADGTTVKAYLRRKAGTLICTRCGSKVRRAGTIRAGVRGGLIPIYFCTQCGYRTYDVFYIHRKGRKGALSRQLGIPGKDNIPIALVKRGGSNAKNYSMRQEGMCE